MLLRLFLFALGVALVIAALVVPWPRPLAGTAYVSLPHSLVLQGYPEVMPATYAWLRSNWPSPDWSLLNVTASQARAGYVLGQGQPSPGPLPEIVAGMGVALAAVAAVRRR